MVIVDTSVLVDFLAGRANPMTLWLQQQLGFRRIGITTLTECEVLQGIREEEAFVATLRHLRTFAVLEIGSQDLAIASARNYRTLRGLGITIRNTIDCLVATFCIENGHELLHRDQDFDWFERHLGLQVLKPPTSGLN